MSLRAPIEYARSRALRGPLIVVDGVADVGWDEVAEIRLESGEVRHGVVLDVSDDLAVVEVFEGTAGLHSTASGSRSRAAPMRIPVGEGWLGRVCNGRGDPLDGGPPIVRRASSARLPGRPINPAARATPARRRY